MNIYDSDRMDRILSKEGCTKVGNPEDANLVIINTCTVREKARHKVLSLLGRIRPLKEQDPNLLIAVAGCVAQQEGKKLLTLAPYIDIVMGPDQIEKFPEFIRQAKNREKVVEVDFSDEEQFSLKALLPVKGKQNLASAFVTIATGCDKKCTFCIVPFVRGVEKCRSPEEIIEECKSLLEFGIKELVLVGQTVNAYKYDGTNFSDLLKGINDLPGLERLRFLTSHPIDMTDDIISCYGNLEHLCEALHLPVQSGSNSVLKRMIRRYTREDYIELAQKIRTQLPSINLTTDIIVGFPGETDEEFEDTLSLLDKVKFDGTYSFIYSPRPKLPSTRISDHISKEKSEERLQMYQSTQEEMVMKTNSAFVGNECEVLVEGPSNSDPKVLIGRTRGNKLVYFPAESSIIGSLTLIKITKAFNCYLRGEVANRHPERSEGSHARLPEAKPKDLIPVILRRSRRISTS